MKRQNAGLWLGTLLFVIGMIFFVQSFSFDYYSQFGPGPGLLPLWLSGALILLSVIYIINCVRKERITFEEILPKGGGAKKLLLILSSMVGFIVTLPYLGFVIAGTLFLFVLLWDAYKWYYSFLISVSTTFILFWIFGSFLSIPLPVSYFGF